jgi:hypothetical protein
MNNDQTIKPWETPPDLTGKTVVAAAWSLQEPLASASERDRTFFCVSKASLGGTVYEGVFVGFWLIDGTGGNTAFFTIEKILRQTPAWAIEKYPRIATLVR